uniref:Uncharacterized protein n=1 Tax=Lactarius sp. (in: basidiomycete fungi) TaxID=1886493 RepID=A0A2Z4M9D3_9AGAM|nr:hypothetical protein [Lactarius sp. (in: basidiomycete fungi)]
MNLNKLTKADLIKKFKQLQEKSNNTGLLAKLLLFKSLILKITLIAVLIKTFRKYSMLRRFWLIFNTLVMTIFGISLFDIYGLSFLSGIIETIRSTYIYSWFAALLSSKEIETPSRLKQINQNSTGNEKSSGLTEGIKRLIIKEEPQIEEDTPIYKNKWVIIAAILLISGLTWWYFGDNLKQFTTTGYSEFKRKPKMDDVDPAGNIELPIQYPPIERSWWNSIKDFFDLSKWRKNKTTDNTPEVLFDAQSQPDIELVDGRRPRIKLDFTKKDPIASSSKVKLEDTPEVNQANSDGSDNSFERYFPDPIDQNEVKSRWNNSPLLEGKTQEWPKIESEVKPTSAFKDLFKSISSLRDKATENLKPVISDTNGGIKQTSDDNTEEFEGKTIPIIKSNKVESPIPQNPSVSNLFDDTMALFDEEPENTLIEDSQQNDVNTSQDSSSSEVIDTWDKVKVEVWDKSKQVNITFGDLWREADSVHFVTNDNYLSVCDFKDLGFTGIGPKTNDVFTWDKRQTSDFNSELKEIIIKDLNGKTHSVYRK